MTHSTLNLKPRSKPAVWIWALVLTLILHFGAIVGVSKIRVLSQDDARAEEPDIVEVVFEPLDPSERDRNQFTELPPDRADEPPESSNLLSNVNSRARDQIEDAPATELPRMDGIAESPQVRMTAGEQVPPETAPTELTRNVLTPDPVDPEAKEALDPAEKPEEAEADEPEPANTIDPSRISQSSGLFAQRKAPPPPTQTPQPQAQPTEKPRTFSADSDITEEEMSNPTGAAGLYGDISLSTTEWEFAPWLQQFRRDFYKHWVAPLGFQIGLIRGGWTMVELEIAPDGQLPKADVLGEAGHPALKSASMGAIDASAPYHPLPGNFPDPTLKLRIRLIYSDGGR